VAGNAWRLEDDVFAADARLKIEYLGPDPFKVYAPTNSLLRRIHGLGAEEVWERDFRWDISDPNKRYFFVRTYANKSFDQHTRMLVEVILQGEQSIDPNKEGKVNITLNARLTTEFPFQSGLQKLPIYRALLWLYFKIFYNDIRRGYFKMAQQEMWTLEKSFRQILQLPVRGVV